MKRFLGDAVMTLPLVDLLETRYSKITFITTSPVAQLMAGADRKFLPLNVKRRPWEVVESARSLRRLRFSTAIVVNHSFRSAATVAIAGIKRRIGHSREGRSWLLTDAIAYSEVEFESKSMEDLATPLGLTPSGCKPRLKPTPEERLRGREILQGAQIGIQPGARFAAKQLPTCTLSELATTLLHGGFKLAMFGGPEEATAGDELEAALNRVVLGTVGSEQPCSGQRVTNLIGSTDIRGSIGALSNLRAMVGADTGLMHIATAAGCPTLTVFGPTPAVKWGHSYSPNRVLQSPNGDITKIPAGEIYAALSEMLDP